MAATRASLRHDLARLGIEAGDAVMVHAGLRAVGAVTGGANTVVQSLQDCIGESGTLFAYVDFEAFYDDDDPGIPVFDKRIAQAARDHGVLHETMRTRPGALRSDHPDAGVLAIGAKAEWLVADHPFQYGYGAGSPFEKFVSLGGKVLMIGAPLDTITILHYAEHLAQIPDKRLRRYRRLMPGDAGPVWVEFEEFDTSLGAHASFPSNCFEVVAEEYLASGQGTVGAFGNATAHVFDAGDLVRFGVQWMEQWVAMHASH